MSTSIEQLAKLGSEPLSLAPAAAQDYMQVLDKCNIKALQSMLSLKNGFYAFESALHVFPAASTLTELGLSEWNDSSLWRYAYNGQADGAIFLRKIFLESSLQFEAKPCLRLIQKSVSLNFLRTVLRIGQSNFYKVTSCSRVFRWRTNGKFATEKYLLLIDCFLRFHSV